MSITFGSTGSYAQNAITILWNVFLATVHGKSESGMTEDELKQKEADKDYFHSSRDANKDGYLDLVIKLIKSLLCWCLL